MLEFISWLLIAFLVLGIGAKIFFTIVPPEKFDEDIKNNDISIRAKHICGLPLANGVSCNLTYTKSNMQILQSGNTFNLNVDKITGITDTTNKEIQKSYVSNAGAAIGGAMLFGALGAIVCGSPSEKTSKAVTHYLVISYQSDGELKYISFEYSPSYKTSKFFRKWELEENKKHSNIDL